MTSISKLAIDHPFGCQNGQSMDNTSSDIIETIRLSDRDKAKLLWAVAETSKQSVPESSRRLRVTSASTHAVLTLIGEGGAKTRFSVLARDLSRWGATLLHGQYIYPETRCELELFGLDHTVHRRVGEVRHVRHIQGMIHNIGIRFEDSIDLSEFVTLSPDEETAHLQELADDMAGCDELDEVTQIVSRVLVVDDYSGDRKLFSYWLTRAGMEVSTANDSTSAKERVEEDDYDLLIIDGIIGDEFGADLISKLRRSQYVGPILAVSADESGEIEQKARACGANEFLSKPLTADRLVNQVHELLGMDQDKDLSPIYSSFNDDREMRPLLTAFTSKLAEQIASLQNANSKNDYDTIDEIARTLKGAGSGYGLETVTEHAQKVMSALEDSVADMSVIRQSVNELIGILNRVRLR